MLYSRSFNPQSASEKNGMQFKSNITTLLLLIILIVLPYVLSAAFLRNEPQIIQQPNGNTVHCLATGDEFYNWLHDENNYTIIQSESNGYYYYAMLEGDKLVPSAFLVGAVDPRNTSLKPGINLSDEQVLQIRKRLEESMFGNEKGRSYSKAAGTLNNLVIYIRFSDQTEFTSDTLVDWNRYNNKNVGVSSVFNYFREVSYGSLNLPSTFYPKPPANIVRSYQDVFPRAYYMPYNATTNPEGYLESQRTQREHTLLVNAVNFVNLNSPVPTSINLDYNNDGRVDNVVFTVRGAPTAWSTLLWPHRWSLSSQTVMINGKRVWDFNFQLETSLNTSGVGVLAHELYHSLGAPDLYRYTNTAIDPVGAWDLMASNNNPPQYMNAHMRFKYGRWINTIPTITQSGTYTLNPLQSATNNAYKILSPNSSQEYFVVEYRKKEGTYDGTLARSGLLIYRVNPAAGNGNAQGPPDEVYIYRPNGTLTVSGSLGDAVFGANYNRTSFSDFTNPSSFLQNGSVGGITISNISATGGETMSFRVDLPGQVQAAISSDVKVACAGATIQMLDASFGIPNNWQWSFSPAGVTYLDGTSSTSKNPKVRFTQEGHYTVSLTAGNSFGTNSTQQTNYLQIGSKAGYFEENFESGTFSNGSWTIENPDLGVTWGIHPISGNGGTKAAGINFRAYFAISQRDRMVSMPYDLRGMSSAFLTFQHAYAQNASMLQFSDSLILYASTNCGQTWTRIATYGEDGNGSFATKQPTSAVFWPEVASDWCGQGWGSACKTINLSNYLGLKDVRFAFETVSFYGNPILVDNIMVSQFVGQNEKSDQTEVQLFPNPANKSFTISLKGNNQPHFVRITNPLGQTVYESAIQNVLKIETQNKWAPGLYTIHLSNGQNQITKKVIIH